MNSFKVILITLMMLAFLADAKRKRKKFVDHSRDALISVVPNNARDREYLMQLARQKIVDLWNDDTMIIAEKKLLRINRCKLKNVKKYFKRRNMNMTVIVPNLQRIIYRNLNSFLMRERNQTFDSRNMNFSRYNAFQNIEAFLKYFTKQHEDISELEIFGKSYEKRPMYAVKISLKEPFSSCKNNSMENAFLLWNMNYICERKAPSMRNGKQIILINCGLHAREWLVTGYKENNKDFKTVLTKYEVIVIPVMNPDGYVYTHEHDRFWRKTRSKLKGTECRGADANRNFYNPGKCDVNDPCAETYCGKKPLSEPETASLKRFLEKMTGKLKAFFDIHAYGQYWMTPWAKRADQEPKDIEKLMKIAKIGADAIEKKFNTKYKVGMASKILYPSNGIEMDFVYEKGFADYSFSLELRDKGDCDRDGQCGFLLPEKLILPTCEETTDGIIAAILAIK